MYANFKRRVNVGANLERLRQEAKARELTEEVLTLNLKQEAIARELTEEVLTLNLKQTGSVGKTLYHLLPVGAARAVMARNIDPYYYVVRREDVLSWVSDHVVFGDDLEIIAVHHKGEVLWADHEIDMTWYFTKENANGR
jgi:hypothetical protein